MMRLRLHVARMGNRRGAYKVLVEKPKEMKTIRKLWPRRESNSNMSLKRICMGLRIDYSVSGQGQVMGCFVHGNELARVQKSGNYWTSRGTVTSEGRLCPVVLVW